MEYNIYKVTCKKDNTIFYFSTIDFALRLICDYLELGINCELELLKPISINDNPIYEF